MTFDVVLPRFDDFGLSHPESVNFHGFEPSDNQLGLPVLAGEYVAVAGDFSHLPVGHQTLEEGSLDKALRSK